jgi:hypothetical protein
METILIEKLRNYIAANNPDLLVQLQGDFSVTQYLEDKVSQVIPYAERLIGEGKPLYAIEELCVIEMTAELRPSRYHYILGILEEEFLQSYSHFREIGVLTYEIINIIESCKTVFEQLGFTEDNEHDRQIRYAVIGTIGSYLEGN